MKSFGMHIFLRLNLCLLILLGTPAIPYNGSYAASVTQADKLKAQRQKEAAKKKKEAEKKKKETEKQRAKRQKEAEKKKQVAQNNRSNTARTTTATQSSKPSQQDAYQKKVNEIEAYNRKVMAYTNRDISHRIGIWGQAGYSSLLQNFNTDFTGHSLGGFGGGAGFGYQLRYKKFLFTTGLEYEQYNSTLKLTDSQGEPLTQTFAISGTTMDYTYSFPLMRDHWQMGYLQLPLLFGAEFEKLYFLAGAKVGYNLFAKSESRIEMNTTAYDNMLMGPIHDVSSHYLVTGEKRTASSSLAAGLNVALSAEIGLNLDPFITYQPKKDKNGKKKENNFANNLHYRVGLFAEYGLLNVQQASNASSRTNALPTVFLADPTDPSVLPITSALQTKSAADVRVNPLLVGVKASIWYELPRKQKKLRALPAEPTPRLLTLVVDEQTGRGIAGALVTYEKQDYARTYSKTTNGKGLVMSRMAKGNYQVSAQCEGYYEMEPIPVSHQRDLQDTLRITLRPRPIPVKYYLAGYVVDGDTRQPLEANVVLQDDNGTLLYNGQSADDGLFVTRLESGTYQAHVTAIGYMPYDEQITCQTDTLTLMLQRIVEGKRVRINNLYFATGKTFILPESEPAMNDLAQFMQDNPEVRILITGHTDNVGSDAANQRLSEGRAEAVRQNLIMRNIDSNRIEATGKGESEPIADNDTEEGRAQNRRVEFQIISTGNSNIEQIR